MHDHYPIQKLNSWRLGTTVRFFSEPKSREALINVYQDFQQHHTILLGLGSNILFPDYELNAHLIRTTKALTGLAYENDFYIESGVSLAKVAKFCTKKGYESAAFLAGIPGTLGGALRMNAGAYGHELWQYVVSVEVLTSEGVKTLSKEAFQIGYRKVILPETVVMFLSARLRFPPGDIDVAKKQIREFLLKRNATQPIGTYNCGSVFKNPEGYSAGRLVDQLGLLGYQVGYARVSPMHGNFIENVQGKASSTDVWKLINIIRSKVLEAYGLDLTLEVTVYE